MPSPHWQPVPEPAPVAAAIAAAVHAAWASPPDEAGRVFGETLRRLVGPVVFDQVYATAFRLLELQRQPPKDYRTPPAWAWFEICPRCQKLRTTKHTAAQNGRIELEVLRDPVWLAEALRREGSIKRVADVLRCTSALIGYWCDRHGILPPKAERAREIGERVAALYHRKEGPGKIARELDTTVQHIRKVLKRLGLANRKHGQVYFEREWWRVRLEDRGYTFLDCTREAGVVAHEAAYWTKKFDLQHLAHKHRRVKFPQLRDPMQLKALLDRHDWVYEHAAKEIGAWPTIVSYWARRLLKVDVKHRNKLPHSHRGWWVDHLDRGLTSYELAEALGIAEKTVREKARTFGLLPQLYRNNAERERTRRAGHALQEAS